MSKTFVAAAAFVALLVPASAASVDVTAMSPTLGGGTILKRAVVKYDDLNPAEAQGAAALYARIDHVAAAICTSNPGGGNGLLADKVEACRVKAVKQAVKDVGSDALAAEAAK